ncbi:hypothetical protein MTO96_027274 [Rhipicephalus appendiculatus]
MLTYQYSSTARKDVGRMLAAQNFARKNGCSSAPRIPGHRTVVMKVAVYTSSIVPGTSMVTMGDDEDTCPPPSSSVVLVYGTTPEGVSEKPSDREGCVQDAAPTERKKLPLKPRSVPVEVNRKGAAVSKAAMLAPQTSSSIFGEARPVDTAAREREIEARLARQREEEERRRIRPRKPFQDSRKDDWVWRSSVAEGSGRPQRFSESGRPCYDDGGRQPTSQQCSNDSRHRSQSSRHGSQAACDATVLDERGDSPKTPPADRIRRPDFGAKVSSAPPSTDAATKSCPKRTTPEPLPRTPSATSYRRPVDDQAEVTGPLQLWTVPCWDQACVGVHGSVRRQSVLTV